MRKGGCAQLKKCLLQDLFMQKIPHKKVRHSSKARPQSEYFSFNEIRSSSEWRTNRAQKIDMKNEEKSHIPETQGQYMNVGGCMRERESKREGEGRNRNGNDT